MFRHLLRPTAAAGTLPLAAEPPQLRMTTRRLPSGAQLAICSQKKRAAAEQRCHLHRDSRGSAHRAAWPLNSQPKGEQAGRGWFTSPQRITCDSVPLLHDRRTWKVQPILRIKVMVTRTPEARITQHGLLGMAGRVNGRPE